MKTNGDVVREILSKVSDEKIYQNCKCTDLEKILCKKINKSCIVDGTTCHKCVIDFLSQPYEEPKRWYLHRYSTSEKCEIYHNSRFINNYTSFNSDKSLYTFEEACKIRTELNKERENKKNLWLIAEVKDEK